MRSRSFQIIINSPLYRSQRTAIVHGRSTDQWGLAQSNGLWHLPRSSSSSTRWKSRQGRDSFAREAKVQGLKSRAAFKLLEIDSKYKLFKRGQTVVDLGFAPGSWSQPPKGVSTIQGNFLSPSVQGEVKRFLADPDRGRVNSQLATTSTPEVQRSTVSGATVINNRSSYVELERHMQDDSSAKGRLVDVVLSDMSAPFEQTTGFWKRSLSDPYFRMMNTSGIPFKDHAGSMDLCSAALQFACETLKVDGHFVCKFYQGIEDKALEAKLKLMFKVVHREKPESSRSESREAFFVALRRRPDSITQSQRQTT